MIQVPSLDLSKTPVIEYETPGLNTNWQFDEGIIVFAALHSGGLVLIHTVSRASVAAKTTYIWMLTQLR